MLVKTGGEILGALVLEERVKDDAREAIGVLRAQGLAGALDFYMRRSRRSARWGTRAD